MQKTAKILIIINLVLASCTSQKKLAYLNNLSGDERSEMFTMVIPDYIIQSRDILYISIKAITPDGTINDYLSPYRGTGGVGYAQNEAGQYIYGYDVANDGFILLPVIGRIHVGGNNLEQAREMIQAAADRYFQNSTVECKLLSFKYTVIGEVRTPGTYINYNNYLTVLEAIGRAGGISDYGRRDRLLVVRPVSGGTRTYTLNLQDKAILSSEAYFLLPNDVVIVEPESKKIFSMNVPTFSFIFTTATSLLTTTLLLINYFGK